MTEDHVLEGIGGALQFIGVLLGAWQLTKVRRNFRQHFNEGPLIYNEMQGLKDALRVLAIEGWGLGILGVVLILGGIVCTTFGAL